jgi:hypothetical protein
MNKKNNMVIRKTYPEVELSVGKPVGKYHKTQYSTLDTMAMGISATTCAVVKATQP